MTTFREPVPILRVDDVEPAACFYVENLGFEQVYRSPPEGEPDFAFLKLEPLGIGVSKRQAEHEAELADQEWGERLTYSRDPDGHLLHVTAKL